MTSKKPLPVRPSHKNFALISHFPHTCTECPVHPVLLAVIILTVRGIGYSS